MSYPALNVWGLWQARSGSRAPVHLVFWARLARRHDVKYAQGHTPATRRGRKAFESIRTSERPRCMVADDRFIWETSSGTRVVVGFEMLGKVWRGRPEVKQAQRHSPAVQARAQRSSSVSEHLNGAPAIFSNHPPERGRLRADVATERSSRWPLRACPLG